MAAHAGLSRRSDSSNDTTILVAAIVVGVFVLLAVILLAFTFVRRRRRNSHQTVYQGSVPPMASYNQKSNISTSSSFLPGMSSGWLQQSPYPPLSHTRLESDTSTRSFLLPEANSGWHHSPHYLPASQNISILDARPSSPEMRSELGYSSHYLTHSRITSDSSTKSLLRDMNNGLDRMEWPVPIHRTPEEDILLNNPAGQYHVPVSRPSSRDSNYTPANSSFCLAGSDVTPSSDNPYLSYRSTQPTPPTLPPLIIPQKSLTRPQKFADKSIPPQIPPTVAEEQVPLQSSAGCASSASSVYSQPTPHSPSHPNYFHIQVDGVLSPEFDPQEEDGDTSFVGTLLKARAERNPDGLVRGVSHVSRIERYGSIKSAGGSDRRYPQRYRAKKSGRPEDLDTLREVSDRGSIQSPA